MGFFNEYPYTDFHEINLDWILRQIMRLHKEYDEFKAVNTITNAGAWDITKQYQAWTIVSDNNKGYISLKPVPAGIAITNAEYWGMVADYNILITDLSNRISALEAEDVVINSRIDALATFNGGFASKNIWFIGDSWTVGFTDSTGDGYVECIRSKNLFKSVNKYAEGGAGYVTLGGNGNNYEGLLDKLIADHGDHPEDVNMIVFVGAVNDLSVADATLTAACESCFQKAKTNFPNADIYTVANINRGASMANYVKMEIPLKVSRNYGIIPLFWPARLLIGEAHNFTNDGYHLKHNLADVFGSNIINNLLGHFSFSPDVAGHVQASSIPGWFTPAVSNFAVDDSFSGLYFYNQYLVFRFDTIKYTSPVSPQTDPLGTIAADYLPPYSYVKITDSPVKSRYANNGTPLGDLLTVRDRFQLEVATGVVRNPLYQSSFSGTIGAGTAVFIYDRINLCYLHDMPPR